MREIVILHDNEPRDVHREVTEVQRTIEQLLAHLQASETDSFARISTRHGSNTG